jgi:hypothetical protein
MNESTSESLEYVPLPARQQLGIYDERVDVDARSGNGVADRLELVESERRDYKVLPHGDGGSRVREVTYHLDNTPPPAEPYGAPGSDTYRRHRNAEGVRLETTDNATTAYQRDEQPVNTQHEEPGRNERIAAREGLVNSHSAEAGSGAAAVTTPSASVEESAPKRKTSAQVLAEVGDDKDKAREALEAEKASENPRSSLISRLEAVVNKDEDSK